MTRLALALALLLPVTALGWSGGVTPPGGGGDGAAITYTPNDGADWSDPDPSDVAAALDALAAAAASAVTATLQDLDDLGVVAAADKFIYSTGAGVWAYGDVTGAARSLLDDETTGVMRATLGLGALATGSDSDDVGFSALDASWPDPDPTTVESALAACGSRLTTLEAATVDAGDVTFTPGTVGDWTGDADPGDVDEALDDLAGRVETLEGAGGGGSADAVTKSITQAGHGLIVGDWIRLSSGDYVEAQANSAANAEVVGVVSAVADVDNFTLTVAGRVTGLSGLTAGTVYYLDASTAGAITATEPTGANVSKPVLTADSTTSGWVLQMRGTIAAAGAGWNWQQSVAAPSASDWTDASNAGADVSLTTLANCSTGSCVRMVPGASTTDRYGATVPIGAGDFTWCGLLGVVTAGVASHGTAQSGAVGFAFVDGADVDTDSHYGIHSVAATDDFASRLLYVNDSNGGGTDEWDAAWTPDANNGYPVMRLEACFSRVGTTLSIYFSPTGAGWVRGVSYTVSADAGLMAVVIDEDDASTDEAVVYSYGDPGGLPWQ